MDNYKIVWSEFTNDYKNTEGVWENKVFYYYGDLSDFNKDDWRFCEVKDKRGQAVFNKLVLHENTYNLKQNLTEDYNSYKKKELIAEMEKCKTYTPTTNTSKRCSICGELKYNHE